MQVVTHTDLLLREARDAPGCTLPLGRDATIRQADADALAHGHQAGNVTEQASRRQCLQREEKEACVSFAAGESLTQRLKDLSESFPS